MEEASGETNQTPKENSRDTGEVAGEQVTVGAEVNHDVDKTLYDAEEFLSNFAGLRDENEQLKQANHELQLQLEKARQDIEQLQLDKQTLEAQLLQEREQSKEELWKVRSEFQALQDERLQWKEKYLNVCMKAANQPTGLGEGSTSSGNKSKGLKRKQGSMSNLNESNSDDFYSNLSSTFGLNDQDDQQPVQPIVTNQLWDPETKRFECKECKATFRMFSNLRSHIDKNKCVKYTFQCPQCSVVFSNATSFTKHLKYHMGKSIQCDFCGDKFMHDKGLQRHIKMYHTDFSQQFQCQYCSKIFGRKTLLENHIRRHFDYRPFKCNFCEKSFKTRQYLTGHVNGVHKNDKQFVCDKCDARFSWRTTWKRHVQNHILKANKKKNKKRATATTTTVLGTISTIQPSVPNLQQQLTENIGQLSHPVTHLTTENLAQLQTSQNLAQLQHDQLTTSIAELTQTVSPIP